LVHLLHLRLALDVNTFSLLAASYVALWANRSDCENIVLVTVEPTPSISANPACDGECVYIKSNKSHAFGVITHVV
jgi:hypothetical protein